MRGLLLAEIRRRVVIEACPLDAATEADLRADPRPGAKAILDAVARRRGENRAEGQRLRHLLRFEKPPFGPAACCMLQASMKPASDRWPGRWRPQPAWSRCG